MLAELLSAALLAYPPPASQGLKPGADPSRGLVALPPSLRRPLHLPTLSQHAACPVSLRRELSPDFAPGLGAGPVHPVGFDEHSVLHYRDAAFPPPWTGQKVLWVASPKYRGPIFIRGHQLRG